MLLSRVKYIDMVEILILNSLPCMYIPQQTEIIGNKDLNYKLIINSFIYIYCADLCICSFAE